MATLEIWGIDQDFLPWTGTSANPWPESGSRPGSEAYKLLGTLSTVNQTVKRISDIWPQGTVYIRAITILPSGSGPLRLKFRQVVA